MDDLISRQMAIDAIRELESGEDFNFNKGLICAMNNVAELPTAEQKRGKWIYDGGLYKCSYCNQIWAEWWALSKPLERMRKECPYCPMCGSYNGEDDEI